MKSFLRNNIAFAKKCTVEESISCTIFFLFLCGCVQKLPFGGAPESTRYYMMRNFFKNSSREVNLLVRAQLHAYNVDTNEFVHWYFSMILTTSGKLFIVALRFSKHLFTEYPRIAASVCYFYPSWRIFCNVAANGFYLYKTIGRFKFI